MIEGLKNFTIVFVGIFVAMDIVGILPLYLGLSQSLEKKKRYEVVNMSILVAAFVAFTFVFIGQNIFKVLGISLPDFKVGGGIVLLVISIMDLVRGRASQDIGTSSGVVPLAVPLITGPGVITTVMLQVGIYGYIIVCLALLANFAFAWLALQKSGLITRLIGDQGTEIISKIAALLMTAIAFSMIRTGLFDAIQSSGLLRD